MNTIINENTNFEKVLHHLGKKYKYYRFPRIYLNKPVIRGGDGKIMYYL